MNRESTPKLGTIDVQRRIAFIEETEVAVSWLVKGIDFIDDWYGGEDDRITGMLLLSQGYERLLKLTGALLLFQRDGALPTSAHIRKKYSHRLPKLVDLVLEEVTKYPVFLSRAAIADDARFLRNDEHWKMAIGILGDFGQGGRYHNLDVLLDGSGNQSKGPLDRWSELEMWIYQHKEDTAFLNRLMQDEPGSFGKEWYPRLAKIQIACLQRAARALCRIWTLGPLQEDARFATGLIGRFLFLQDHQLPFIPSKRPEGRTSPAP